MDRLFSDNASDGPTSDTASDCFSDDNDDYDYDLKMLEIKKIMSFLWILFVNKPLCLSKVAVLQQTKSAV